MNEESFYGIDGFYSRNNSDASDQPFPATFDSQEEQQIEPQGEFNTSDRRLDSYHLYFSSRL